MSVRPTQEAIEARANAATPGPWRDMDDHLGTHAIVVDEHGDFVADTLSDRFDADVAFIAHAREDVPFLLGRVRELEDALRRSPCTCWDHVCARCRLLYPAAVSPERTSGPEGDTT